MSDERTPSGIPHDWVALFVTENSAGSKDTISQCARCNMMRHDYEYDGGKRSPNYPMFHLRGMGAADSGCSRGDMTEERAAGQPMGHPPIPSNPGRMTFGECAEKVYDQYRLTMRTLFPDSDAEGVAPAPWKDLRPGEQHAWILIVAYSAALVDAGMKSAQPTEQPSPSKEHGARRCHVKCNNAAVRPRSDHDERVELARLRMLSCEVEYHARPKSCTCVDATGCIFAIQQVWAAVRRTELTAWKTPTVDADRATRVWRTGRRNGHTIYIDDEPAAFGVTPERAAQLVADANIGVQRRREHR